MHNLFICINETWRFNACFEYLKQLEQTKQEGLEQEPRKVIEGYRKEKRSKKS